MAEDAEGEADTMEEETEGEEAAMASPMAGMGERIMGMA
jgi:hypothetical protein